MGAIHRCLAPSLPGATPLQLATALWSYAAVGTQAGWLDELLLQASRCLCLHSGAGRVASALCTGSRLAGWGGVVAWMRGCSGLLL